MFFSYISIFSISFWNLILPKKFTLNDLCSFFIDAEGKFSLLEFLKIFLRNLAQEIRAFVIDITVFYGTRCFQKVWKRE